MMRVRILHILCLIMLLSVLPAAKAAEKPADTKSETFASVSVPFVDEASKDPSFLAFRTELLGAIEKKDVPALLGVLDGTIRSSFGDDEGIDAFKRMWELEKKPEASRVWKELGTVLRLGGVFSKGEKETFFISPYLYANFPEESDPTEFAAVVGDGVRVRSKPNETGEMVAKVSRIVVRVLESDGLPESTIENETYAWKKVALPDGKEGYVWGKYLRSPLDYRAGFSNESGKWKMIYFLAGD